MNKPLQNDLQELVAANIITDDIARQITEYYQAKQNTPSSNKFNLVLGLLGAILVGSGIILLVAHNWDMLGKLPKTILAFLPLTVAQVISVYAILRKSDNRVWQEGSATFLFCAVPTAIAIISQVYQVDGSLPGFLLTWLALTIPLVYVHKSSMVSLLVIAIATWYGCEIGYHQLFSSSATHYPYLYLVILLCLAPWYYRLAARYSSSNFFHLHNWLLSISLSIVLGSFSGNHDDTTWLFTAYISLFGLYYILGNTIHFRGNRFWANPFRALGIAGILVIIIGWTFPWAWDDFSRLERSDFIGSPLSYMLVVILTFSVWLIIRNVRNTGVKFDLVAYSSFLFIVVTLLSNNAIVGTFLTNCMVIAIAISYIRKGSLQNHLGILNFGLFIIALLAVLRFFDTDIPFIWRGTFFVSAGIGFFAANYLLLKRRKNTLTQNTNA